jgi:4'-phosphopantetheinyl transferase
MSPAIGNLDPNDVHCWRFDPGNFEVEALAPVLSDEERERARRFVFDRDRKDYMVCRGLLRHLLAAYGVGSASALMFSYTDRGKPMLPVDRGPSLVFNVAHTRGAGLIGLARGAALGVDIEGVRTIESFISLASTCFSREEQAELAALPPCLHAMAFYAGWTRKEALIKATGEGLGRPLDSFAVTIGPENPPRLIRLDDYPHPPDAWQIVDLTQDSRFAAAAAVSNVHAIVRVGDLFAGDLGLAVPAADGRAIRGEEHGADPCSVSVTARMA